MRERSSAKSRKSPFEAYLHVLHALILRDMRTRFGASMWGYGVVVLWPCVHVFVLITIYTVQKLAAPLGDDVELLELHRARLEPREREVPDRGVRLADDQHPAILRVEVGAEPRRGEPAREHVVDLVAREDGRVVLVPDAVCELAKDPEVALGEPLEGFRRRRGHASRLFQ